MSNPIRIGILGAARITGRALIEPAAGRDDVQLAAVAARDRGRAEAYASEHGIATVLDSYDDVVDSPDLDAIYIPLPASHHAHWSIRALQAGKHVLVEKPFAANASEARQVAEVAAMSDTVLMEAFHYRYHALLPRLQEMLAMGLVGDVTDISATFDIHMPDRSNIRYQLPLGGGATMDLGCYPLHLVRTLMGSEPEVLSASARRVDGGQVDEALEAKLQFHGGVTSTVRSSLLEDAEEQSARITGTLGTIDVDHFVHPQAGNRITLTVEGGTTTQEIPQQPSSYAAQLAAFVAAVRDGVAVATGPSDAVANMEVIDAMYRAAGLDPRPSTLI
ncbi:Gfo/Idh/MocA family protein [Tessaracoccus antarcticus]|uniref:Gfo/Idh/MocA family oxidoreductase n=1 Tax=Tessaracoccus antarcticus TaxID=2479848 RepID=A0A3M0G4J3_9ACTN|nr:Gfo/Idh/MocA family oxidoreductase [Tessaracoccus antarcticus]RMB59920.1 gfo/Idh/MocA family oxidoreductase [Tessaracoccus antarcticus]